jgi:hypothetical protein
MSQSIEARAEWVMKTIPRGTLFVQGVIQRAKTDEDIRREEKARKVFPNYLIIFPEQQQVRAMNQYGHYYHHTHAPQPGR